MDRTSVVYFSLDCIKSRFEKKDFPTRRQGKTTLPDGMPAGCDTEGGGAVLAQGVVGCGRGRRFGGARRQTSELTGVGLQGRIH